MKQTERVSPSVIVSCDEAVMKGVVRWGEKWKVFCSNEINVSNCKIWSPKMSSHSNGTPPNWWWEHNTGRINKICDTKGDKCDRGCFPLFLLCDIVLRKEGEAGERGNDRSSNFALVEGDIVYNSGVREKIRERRMYDVRLKGNTMSKIFLTDRIFSNDERKSTFCKIQ